MSILGQIGKFLGFSGGGAVTPPVNERKKVDVATLRAEATRPANGTAFYDLNEGAKMVADIKKKWPNTFSKIRQALDIGIDRRPDFKDEKTKNELKDHYDEFHTEVFPVLAALFLHLKKDLSKSDRMKDMPASFFAAAMCEMSMYILWHHEFEETRDKRPPLKIDGIDNPKLAQALAVGAHVQAVMNPLVELLWAVANLQAQEEINKIK